MKEEKLFEVYYVSNKNCGITYLQAVNFTKKENADAFIAIMRDEGYEIDKAGYIG